MEILENLLNDETMKQYLESQEESILGGAQAFHEFPQVIKDYVQENLDQFIGKTVKETYDNIVQFTETAALQYLSDIVESIES